jgi:hypothetical protein
VVAGGQGRASLGQFPGGGFRKRAVEGMGEGIGGARRLGANLGFCALFPAADGATGLRVTDGAGAKRLLLFLISVG